MLLAAKVARKVCDEPQLGRLLLGRELGAVLGAREAALRADAELAGRDVLRRLVDPGRQVGAALEDRRLGADQAEDHLVALRYMGERGEAAGARVVELEEEAVDGKAGKYRLGDRLVAAGRGARLRKVAAAE